MHGSWNLKFHSYYLGGRWTATNEKLMSIAGTPLVWFVGKSRDEVTAQIDNWEKSRR